MTRIAILGGGAWGTALATVAASRGSDVVLWARELEVVQSINERHVNEDFLPGIELDPRIVATGDLAEAVSGYDAVLGVVPAQYMRSVLSEAATAARLDAPLVICAKGIETRTMSLMSDVVGETLQVATIAVLSGPTFASDVARGMPTAVTLACEDENVGRTLVEALGTQVFRPYLTSDVVGTQLGGAVKNVLAIASGVIEGMNLGDNARAAIVTRGLAETVRLGEALGARRETLMGLSGLGDLALTCYGHQSRNMSLGIELGRGRSVGEILAERTSVAEGVPTAAAVVRLARRHNIEMPICEAVNSVLHEGTSLGAAIQSLLTRAFTTE